jgi:hypothetical protein
LASVAWHGAVLPAAIAAYPGAGLCYLLILFVVYYDDCMLMCYLFRDVCGDEARTANKQQGAVKNRVKAPLGNPQKCTPTVKHPGRKL